MKQPTHIFSKSFLEYMHVNDAWPEHSKMGGLCETVGVRRAYSSTSYNALRNGQRASRKLHLALIKVLVHLANFPSDRCGTPFRKYVESRGIALSSTTPELLLMAVSDPLDDLDRGQGFVRRGILATAEFLGVLDYIANVVRECEVPHQVDRAIQWMFVGVGKHLKGESLSVFQAKKAAELHLKCTADCYVAQAIKWRLFNPWTVVQTRGFSRAGGMSIVLPINDAAYNKIVSGEMRSYDCEPSDLTYPSSILLFESCFERPFDMGGEPHRAEMQLLMAVLTQCAVLGRVPKTQQSPPLRLLSFAGTPENQRRLESHGFKSLGVRMRDTNVLLYERQYAHDLRDPMGKLFCYILTQFAHFHGHLPPPSDD